MEQAKIMLNMKVYIVVAHEDYARIDVVGGIVDGGVASSSAIGNYKFRIRTANAYFWRHACDIYESVEAVQSDIPNMVVE